MNPDSLQFPDQITPANSRIQSWVDRIDAVVISVAARWLGWTLGFMATIVGLAVAAPILQSSGFPQFAKLVYLGYRTICHQHADRSFLILGEPMAFCQRDTAIVAGGLVATAMYGVLQHRFTNSPLPLALAILAALPMAIDGSTQLVGLRESTWELRVVTGALFAVGVAWFTLPHLDRGFARLVNDSLAVPR